MFKVEDVDATKEKTARDDETSIMSPRNDPKMESFDNMLNEDSQLDMELDENAMRKKGIDEEKIERVKMSKERRNSCLIYPDSKRKAQWDLWITLVLLITCILTPLSIAFVKDNDSAGFNMSAFSIIELFFDFNFFIDIIVNFTSCYYHNEVELIDDPKVIACTYLKGWFLVDFVSILPIDLIFSFGGFTHMLRVARIGKLGKLVKLTRLLRVLKILKDQSRILAYMSEFLKIGLGFERLFFFGLIFFILCHILTCLWVIFANVQDETYKGTWIEAGGWENESNEVLYAISFYWAISTITTVGYGDISGTTTVERIYCFVSMLIGVISFSFANGALTSIISNSDQANAKFQEKELTLNRIR